MRRSTSSPMLALAAGGLLALSPMHANAAGFTFDSDLEGWEAVGIEIDFIVFPPTLNSITLVQNDGDMVHEAADGNPDGYARLTDAIEEPSSLAGAPASFLNGGDLTSFIGGTFSFDHRLFDTGTPVASISPYSVIFLSGDPIDFNAVVWTAPAPAGATDWVHFEFTVDESELTLIENVPLSVFDSSLPLPSDTTLGDLGFSGSMTFDEIMGSVDELLVAFELVNNLGVQNQEHGGIDNVQLVPAPGACDGLGGDTDGDTLCDDVDNCPMTFNTGQADTDGDDVGDACDNCTEVFNQRVASPPAWLMLTGGQRDDDGDGYGNICDGKFDTPGTNVGQPDVLEFVASLGKNRETSSCGTSGSDNCARYDLDGGSATNIGQPDVQTLIGLLGAAPGPRCAGCPLP